MTRFFLALASLCVAFLCCASPAPPAESEMLRTVNNSLVAMHSPSGFSAGIVVRTDPDPLGWQLTILLSGHAADAGLDHIHLGEHKLPVVLLDRHPEHDAAIAVAISPEYVEPLPLNLGVPDPAEKVWAVGFPASYGPHFTSGFWSGNPNLVSAPIWFGNSGGPVVDSWGHALALVRGLVPLDVAVPHLNVVVPLHLVEEWLSIHGVIR